ncbi:MAG TPA: tol-pal system protein YbgF [Methylotenera sp.]|nr:tol-pal system protein YbgF [Methylotenera sp.]HPV44302.1 tol-pal system protein YbgF [Methylotenera sp.]
MAVIKKLVFAGLTLFTLASFTSAHAALFDDKEARKKILELEAKQQSNHDASMAAIADLKKRVAAIEAVVQGQGLADMSNQIEALKQEVANLKGDLEVALHALDTTQQRQKDLYTDTDTRLRKLESGAPVAANGTPANTPPANAPAQPPAEEKDVKAFADADSLSKSAKHKEAFAAFDSFLKEYPNSKLVPDALYGMGYSQFALKNYKSSIATQQKVVDLHPASAKVPDAMFNMANSQIQLGQVTNARKTLRSLIEKFPDAEVTPNAKKRLKALEAIR